MTAGYYWLGIPKDTFHFTIQFKDFIISPYGRCYRIWETFLNSLAVYTAWVSPFEFGFFKEPQSPLSIMDNIVNGFFAMDIVLTFFVAYINKYTYSIEDKPKQIALNYARTWLAYDVIAIIPLELIGNISPAPNLTYVLFNMLRLLRLRRVSALFSRLPFLLFIVLDGCFYNLVAASNYYYYYPKEKWVEKTTENFLQQSMWTRYVTSIYHSIGYGDSNPVNEREMIFSIFRMLFNIGLTTYLIVNVVNLAVHDTSQTIKFREARRDVLRFAQRNKLPLRLADKMLAHLSLKFRIGLVALTLPQETPDSLPKAIKINISHYLFYSIIYNAYLFRGVSKALHSRLVSEMKPQYFPPKEEDVFLESEAPTDLYIVVSGAVVVGKAIGGDIFGETGVLCCKPQLFTFRTKRLSHLLRLSRTALLSMVDDGGEDGTIIMNNLLQHSKELNSPIMKELLGETQNMLALSEMNLPHIAASRGDENLVLLLLEYGADSNIRDFDGNVPLWEAILGGHESVSKLLVENGAALQCGDVGQYACTAVELNSPSLLRDIRRYRGDITLPNNNNGKTTLHVAVAKCNVELVKFLLDHGANTDKSCKYGWTPRNLADKLGHPEIKAIFESRGT